MKLINKLDDKLTETVTDMCIGEFLFGLLCEFIGVWFVHNQLNYSIGIWAGVFLSMFCTWHISHSIDLSLSIADPKAAGKYVGSRYIIRYFALIILIVILYFTGIGNAFAAFLGYMGMKPAAYIQPFIHKVIRR